MIKFTLRRWALPAFVDYLFAYACTFIADLDGPYLQRD